MVMKIVHTYKRKGWRFRWRLDWKAGPAHCIRDWHKREIYTPYPDCPYFLNVFLHEWAHAQLRHHDRDISMHEEEYEAEQFAMTECRDRWGIPVSREYLEDARMYVRECIIGDEKLGVQINPKVRRWSNPLKQKELKVEQIPPSFVS